MKALILSILSYLLLSGCTNKVITKIQWAGEIVNTTHTTNFLYWNDGNEFLTQQDDSIAVSLAGFEFDNSIYILVSLKNNKTTPITFYTKNCTINYQFKSKNIDLQPVKPKNLDKSHFSFFNTVVGGAGQISRLFLNIPVDMLFSTDEINTQDQISGDYHDDSINMTKKIFMNNHTLFPGTNYAGFLVFEYDPEKFIKETVFDFAITFTTEIKAKGKFVK